MARSTGLPASLHAFGRAARAQAAWLTRAARYRRGPPVALTSRPIVDGARPSAAAIARIDRPAASPREISSRSARLNRPGARRRDRGRIPPQRSRYARTVPVHKPSSRAVGFAACPARNRAHTWSIASGVNRS
jgi:hypothetical protein